MCKLICPSSEFTQWKLWFALKWKKYDRQSYEFGLLRQTISGVFGGKASKLDDYMLQKLIKQGELPWEWLSEEEQQAKIEASKRAHGYYEDK